MEEDHGELDLPWNQRLYVTRGPLDGELMRPQALNRRWHEFAHNLEIVGMQGEHATLHNLRHTLATTATNNGVDLKTISVILVRSNAAMTLNVYSDALATSKRSGTERLDALMAS